MQLIKKTSFNGVELDCYVLSEKLDISSDFWATREQIGKLLEYVQPEVAITKIHQRNPERLDKFSTVTKLVRVEGGRTVEREVIVYNFKGLLEICRFSNQPKANAVMDFLWDIADEIRRTGSYNERYINTEEDKRRTNLEAAKLIQHMVDSPDYPLNKKSRAAITRYIVKLISGEDLIQDTQTDLDDKCDTCERVHECVLHRTAPRNYVLHPDDLRDCSYAMKQLRISLNLTQDAFAKILGIHRNTVGRWENGTKRPSKDAIKSIAKVLEYPVGALLKFQEN